MNFIDGVILIEETKTWSTIGLLVLIVMLVIGTAIGFGGCTIMANTLHYANAAFARFIGLIIALIGIAVLLATSFTFNSINSLGPIVDEYGLSKYTGEYKVTVTDDTDMNEFQQKYEIISYINGVYTIKIK